jgi:hydroxyacyl-ACP dehydratase HTD2-like protein with hotdog domain
MRAVSPPIPEIQAKVGQEASFQASEPVDAGKIRRFAKALGFENPLYYDLDRGQPVAPLTYVFSVNHDSLAEWDSLGRPTYAFSPPPAQGLVLRAGNDYRFSRPVRVGDLIRTRRRVKEVKEKIGQTGPLLFLTYDLEYTTQTGEPLGLNTETIILQTNRPTSKNQEVPRLKSFMVPGEGDEIPPLQVQISKLLMFRYAAAAGNAYLLHWDSDFSRRHGLPNVNAPGYMFGDYLTEMLVRWTKNPESVKSLKYTNRAMAFAGDTLVCRGKIRTHYEEGGKRHAVCLVWVENQKRQMLVEGSAAVIWA